MASLVRRGADPDTAPRLALATRRKPRTLVRPERLDICTFENKEYDDWYYWRASWLRGMRGNGIERGKELRPNATTMCQLLKEAFHFSQDPIEREDALRRVAIRLYSVATFLFKAVNYAMRDWESTQVFARSSTATSGSRRRGSSLRGPRRRPLGRQAVRAHVGFGLAQVGRALLQPQE